MLCLYFNKENFNLNTAIFAAISKLLISAKKIFIKYYYSSDCRDFGSFYLSEIYKEYGNKSQ